LIVGGFDGASLPDDVARELRAGRRAGLILFRRNLEYAGGQLVVEQVTSLNKAIIAATAENDDPPFISVDQEGGKVARLKAPVLELPPMRVLAAKELWDKGFKGQNVRVGIFDTGVGNAHPHFGAARAWRHAECLGGGECNG
jgi:beta-N-acetylhexosaminidase